MSTLKNKEAKNNSSNGTARTAKTEKLSVYAQRNYVSTYLSDKEAQQFNSVLGELGITKAALGKALIRVGLSKLRRPLSSKEALRLMRLGNLN
jgi:hypothetical protein